MRRRILFAYPRLMKAVFMTLLSCTVLTGAMSVVGCSQMKNSELVSGGVLGALGGAGISALAGGNAGVGALVGGGLGALAGSMVKK